MRSGPVEKMMLREGLSHILRGYGILRGMEPAWLPIGTALGALRGIQPLVAVFFSARVVAELSGARDVPTILLYAALAVGSAFALHIAVSALDRRMRVMSSVAWESHALFRGKRFATMDFVHVENRDVNELRAQIDAKENAHGLGLLRLLSQHGDLVQALVGAAGSAALFAGMFAGQNGGGGSFLTSPWPLALLLASFAIPLLLRTRLMRWSMKVMAKIHEEIPISNTTGGNYMDYIAADGAGKDVRLYAQKEAIAKLVHRALNIWFEPMSRTTSVISGVTAAANAVVGGLAYVVIGLRALVGMYTIGQVTQYVGAVTAFSGSLTKLIGTVTMMWENAAYLPMLYELLDLPDVKYRGTLSTEKRADNDYAIEFHDVSFRYPGSERWALRHLNLKLNVGERLAVVGRNGSGKTTMIKLLCRLYDPTEGRITLNGIDIGKYDYDEYIALFSVVFQDFKLPSLPLGQNIAASAHYDAARADEALDKVGLTLGADHFPRGLDTCIGKDYDENGVLLSGGEAQKAALARAIYKAAPFVVLDEPTAALDPLAEYEIYSKFDAISGGRTTVYISHRLSSCRFCEDIAVFDGGRLVQRGGHDALLADPRDPYRALWTAQAQHYQTEADRDADSADL